MNIQRYLTATLIMLASVQAAPAPVAPPPPPPPQPVDESDTLAALAMLADRIEALGDSLAAHLASA